MTKVNHKLKKATVKVPGGKNRVLEYDQIIMTAGAVTRTFPIKGVAEEAIGIKTVEEAVEIRNRMVGNFERAAALPKNSKTRRRLLTTVVVGGGFAGWKLSLNFSVPRPRWFATTLRLTLKRLNFTWLRQPDEFMPEVSLKTSLWVIANLEKRNARVHLNTQLSSADKGLVTLSTENLWSQI